VPILVFLGLSVLELSPMYATDRCQTKASLNVSALWGQRHNNEGGMHSVKGPLAFQYFIPRTVEVVNK